MTPIKAIATEKGMARAVNPYADAICTNRCSSEYCGSTDECVCKASDEFITKSTPLPCLHPDNTPVEKGWSGDVVEVWQEDVRGKWIDCINDGRFENVTYRRIYRVLPAAEKASEGDGKLIADFMDNYKSDAKGRMFYNNRIDPDTYEFDTSWDWLMPVIEKIKSVSIWNDDISNYEGPSNHPLYLYIDEDIQSVYASVVAFIKWFDGQN